jgi:hypothetical protein
MAEVMIKIAIRLLLNAIFSKINFTQIIAVFFAIPTAFEYRLHHDK